MSRVELLLAATEIPTEMRYALIFSASMDNPEQTIIQCPVEMQIGFYDWLSGFLHGNVLDPKNIFPPGVNTRVMAQRAINGYFAHNGW